MKAFLQDWIDLRSGDFQADRARMAHCYSAMRAAWRIRESGVRHRLPGRLITSLTTYPKRYNVVVKTLQCLLSQSVRADAIILWVADEDTKTLPREIARFQKHGVIIEATPNIGSYKKIIPALRSYPDAFIATADDDVFYGRDWLEQLCDAYRGSRAEIPCHRAHQITRDQDGKPRPYAEWQLQLAHPCVSPDVFSTGCGGALFPPESLDPRVVDGDFLRICPTADDVWLYGMARLAGSCFKKIGPRYDATNWPKSQACALANDNLRGGNDRQLRCFRDAIAAV